MATANITEFVNCWLGDNPDTAAAIARAILPDVAAALTDQSVSVETFVADGATQAFFILREPILPQGIAVTLWDGTDMMHLPSDQFTYSNADGFYQVGLAVLPVAGVQVIVSYI